MKTTSYSEFRADLASRLDEVNADREPLMITRQGRQAAVLLAAEDYAAIETTLHLLRSPKNAERLRESIIELNEGGGTEHGLIDPS